MFFRNISDLATNDIKRYVMCLDLNRYFNPIWDKRENLQNLVSKQKIAFFSFNLRIVVGRFLQAICFRTVSVNIFYKHTHFHLFSIAY